MTDNNDNDGDKDVVLNYIGRFTEKLNDLYNIRQDFSGRSKTNI